MDDLFSSLAMQTVHLVGKAAFGAASSLAMRRVTEYVNSTQQAAATASAAAAADAELAHQHMRFETTLRVVTPAIDLIELISSRGHSTTSGVLQLTARLRKDIQQFAAALPAQPDQSAKTTEGTQATLARMRMLVDRIDAAVPLLNLALTTSGAHLGAALPDGVSPGRLMQASGVLARAPSSVAGEGALVGPVFTLRLFSLFAASVRAKTLSDVTWKEEYVICHAALWKMPGDLIEYELRVVEDLDDGRYHEESEDATPSWAAEVVAGRGTPGRVLRMPLGNMCSLHYTSAGALLNIEDSVAPVVVISLASSSASKNNSDVALSDADKKWYAMEVASVEDVRAADRSDNEDESEEKDKAVQRQAGAKGDAETVDVLAEILDARCVVEKPVATSTALSDPLASSEPPAGWAQCSLSLLEYMVRLACVETNEQVSHLDVPDERLRLYLMNAPKPAANDPDDAAARKMRESRTASSRTLAPATQ
ncbi:Ran-specific GTPase-activating protein 30 [Coemansia sp. RSA 2703]|nr:Ran-specific GTPase-activating protein 30 [Coemansia sp. RSA 2703]KAJ2397838.1 Ran-specific GTPase-activating protein 30 [Coemansia sp. RSA 2603]